MTNTDFFRAFAADTSLVKNEAYFFVHDDDDYNESKLVQPSSSFNRYMFHYDQPNIPLDRNESNNVHQVFYRGGLFVVEADDVYASVDGVRSGDYTDGLYERIVRSMIESGGINKLLSDFQCLNSTYNPVLYTPKNMSAIYHRHFGQFTGTGIWMTYEMRIRHQTQNMS